MIHITPRRSCAVTVSLLTLILCACGGSSSLDNFNGEFPVPPTTSADLSVFVIVVDSLMPQEIGAALTPTTTLANFRSNATTYNESRSVFYAETIPNHVAMMTGVYPEKSGIPANTYWNRQGTPEDRDLSLPSELEASTLFTRIKQECPNIRTAAALSKDYLYEIFSECGFSGTDCGINVAPDAHFDPTADPTFLPSPAGLTPDISTMQAALSMLPTADFMFINLGQVDRMGHADASGATGTPILRNLVMQDTDLQIQRFIQALQDAGRWDKSVVFIVSDHGMDWSLPTNFINVNSIVELFGLFPIQNGGTESFFLTNPADTLRDTKLLAARTALLNTQGIEHVWYRELNTMDPDSVSALLPSHFQARHENIGDLVASAAPGYRFSEPDPLGNPLPGNHAHKITLHNTFMIGGGASFVRAQIISEPDEPVDHFERRPAQSENVDVAPTVAWLLGMSTTGFDGRALTEAFTSGSPPSLCGVMR